jgi:hypothetical protein
VAAAVELRFGFKGLRLASGVVVISTEADEADAEDAGWARRERPPIIVGLYTLQRPKAESIVKAGKTAPACC